MRETCEGSGGAPLPFSTTDEGLRSSTWSWKEPETGSTTLYFAEDRVVCSVCHEPRKPLRDGRLSKHTRYVGWREQQARRAAEAER